jgi:hypothetical protein
MPPIARNLLLALAALATGLAAISHQSFWMDEGGTIVKAMMPTLSEFWRIMKGFGGSDMQNPLYMLLAWAWHHAGAVSEFALRSLNLPWLVVAVLALRKVKFWPLVCLTSPLVLYYVGEFRQYAMHIAAGALAAAALGKVIEGRERGDLTGLHALCAACLWLVLNGLTSAVWAAGVALAAVVIRTDWLFMRSFWVRVCAWLVPTMAMGAYFAWTLMEGYRAAGTESAGLLNVFFGFYEMIGLLGIGPSRNELRISPATAIPYLGILIPAFLCIAGAWACGVCSWISTTPRRCVLGVACAVAFPILFLTVVGQLQDFRVLGRHFSPGMPAVLLPIAASFTVRGRMRIPGIVLGSLAVAFMTVSSLNLRFQEKHARDDYRRATDIGIQALMEGKRLWWKADLNSTRYYAYLRGGIPLMMAIQKLETEAPEGLMFADMVVINRPDIRFKGVDYQAELRRNYFKPVAKFTGFEVWANE